jgi:hypothetical protein
LKRKHTQCDAASEKKRGGDSKKFEKPLWGRSKSRTQQISALGREILRSWLKADLEKSQSVLFSAVE